MLCYALNGFYFVIFQKWRILRSLHHLLAEHSKREEISIVHILFLEMMLFFQNKNYRMSLKSVNILVTENQQVQINCVIEVK